MKLPGALLILLALVVSEWDPERHPLSLHSGCDEIFIARDPDQTAVLSVQVPGLLERARGSALPYEERLRVGESSLVVRLELGTDLDYWCTDVLQRPPRIEAAWTGVSGTATVVVLDRLSPHPGGAGSIGTHRVPTSAVLRLKAVTVAREGSPEDVLRIPDLEIAATLGVPAGG